MNLAFTSNKQLLLIIIAVFIYSVFQCLYFTGNQLSGNYKYLIAASESFGIPNELEKAGYIEPLYKTEIGWDGQFYYYISNDIFAKKYQDETMASYYRYQRVGVPLIAKTLSLLTFQSIVSIPTYLATSLILICLALYLLGSYLLKNGYSVLWMLPWVLSYGIQQSWRHGQIDAGADALCIIAVVMLIERRYILYSVVMALACLSKEGYIIIAFMFFMLNVNIFFQKPYFHGLKKIIIFTFPGAIWILWHAYLTVIFGHLSRGAFETFFSWPFYSFFEAFISAVNSGNLREVLFLVIYVTIVLSALAYSMLSGFKNKLFLAFVPYVFMCACYNRIIMEDLSGYMKNISVLFALIAVMQPNIKFNRMIGGGNVLRYSLICFLFIYTMVSIDYTYNSKQFSSGYPQSVFSQGEIENKKPLTNFNGEIEVVDSLSNVFVNIPFGNFFTPNYKVYQVQIKNTGTDIWYRKSLVTLSYHWFKEGELNIVIMDGIRSALPHDIAQGESAMCKMYVQYPKKKGKYILRLTMVQDGVSWFYSAGNLYKDIKIEID